MLVDASLITPQWRCIPDIAALGIVLVSEQVMVVTCCAGRFSGETTA